MDAASLEYWLPIIIGVPQALVWFGIVVLLGWLAARGDSPPRLRRVAASNTIVCAAVTAAYFVVIFWRPVWYVKWIDLLLFLFILGCFGVALQCLLWRKNPPKSAAERRLAIGFGLYIGALNVGIVVATVLMTDWYNLLFLAPYGILLAAGCVYHRRTERRIKDAGGAGLGA